ncbi:MAG: hypothetical protein AAF846_06800 [Chloroflexota bacterium]
MSEKKKKNDYSQRPAPEYWDPDLCPVCGNNDFTWGRITPVQFFKPSQNIISGKKIEARQCNRCGNLQLFAEKD